MKYSKTYKFIGLCSKTCFSRGRSKKILTFKHKPGSRGKKDRRESITAIQRVRSIQKHTVVEEERSRLKLKK